MAPGREHMTVEERARRVKLLLFDVDGVLTDGIVVMHADGSESKGFQAMTPDDRAKLLRYVGGTNDEMSSPARAALIVDHQNLHATLSLSGVTRTSPLATPASVSTG